MELAAFPVTGSMFTSFHCLYIWFLGFTAWKPNVPMSFLRVGVESDFQGEGGMECSAIIRKTKGVLTFHSHPRTAITTVAPPTLIDSDCVTHSLVKAVIQKVFVWQAFSGAVVGGSLKSRDGRMFCLQGEPHVGADK